MKNNINLSRSMAHFLAKVREKKKPLHFCYKGFSYKISPGIKEFQTRGIKK